MIAPANVEIRFECLPLRSIQRWDIPLDASPKFQAKCERIQTASRKHGTLNTFYLHEGFCRFRLTNHDELGQLQFTFEGTATTDPWDERTIGADLDIQLRRETCDWLTEPIVRWFQDTVARAVKLEFDRYIAAGDLVRTKERLAITEFEWERRGGFVGMGL